MNRRSLFKSFLSTAAAITAASAMECLGLARLETPKPLVFLTDEWQEFEAIIWETYRDMQKEKMWDFILHGEVVTDWPIFLTETPSGASDVLDSLNRVQSI